MCGIFGYLGHKNNAGQIVLEGLKRLDYRGYDSWGVGVATGKNLVVEKQVGKISDISSLKNLPKSNAAIAHTRWATTGAVTQINAHPQLSSDKTFLLAQNGIVENFEDLKNQLAQKGYKFMTQTDTEVIVRLIQDCLKPAKKFIEAVRAAFLRLDGRNTIIILTRDGEIYAARNGSPLVLGQNTKTGEVFLSSDALSFAPQADRMIVVDNQQMVWVTKTKTIKLFNLKSGKRCPYKFQKLTLKADKIDKEGHPHFMIKEIYETPSVVRQIMNQDKKPLFKLVQAVKGAKAVYVIGSGTTGIAASQIAFYLRLFGQIKAVSLVGADARSWYDIFQPRDLMIAPSQSGETADVLEVLEYARKRGLKIASLVNMPGSMMTRLSHYPFMCGAGPEICVMSTKVFTSQISWGYLLAKSVQGKFEEGRNNLGVLATAIHNYLEDDQNHKLIKDLAARLVKKPHIFLLGKYQNFSIICEGMVKIIEASYKHAHALPAGDLKHYAITLMEKGVPVVAAVSEDMVKNDMMTAINEVRLRGAEVIAIAHEKKDNFDDYIPTEDTRETDAISNIIPLQLLAYYMALILGNNIDKPRHIAKSVTVK